MSQTKLNQTSDRLPEVTLPNKGKLILNIELQNQIDYAHSKVGNIEWCGVLFYEVTDGDFLNPETLVMEAKHFYMMDIGSSAYTEATFTPELTMDMFETIPNAEDLRRGIIHTHHSMSTFA